MLRLWKILGCPKLLKTLKLSNSVSSSAFTNEYSYDEQKIKCLEPLRKLCRKVNKGRATLTLLRLLRIFAVGHWQEKKEDNVKSPGQQEAYNSPLRVLTAIFPPLLVDHGRSPFISL